MVFNFVSFFLNIIYFINLFICGGSGIFFNLIIINDGVSSTCLHVYQSVKIYVVHDPCEFTLKLHI